ncbi:uncharacterized protein si:rp71-46j2.7 [Carcharodon carcharias]|uniref:uncharacterized protein si:rp71-46j2.7 n=1 Tax=Carcharodon carcharias TaxID=13397 RepID=UPI001B7EF01F|nr:uncharacterized protein si:rp71-46j2.7 [Carcharodon carcharias]
MDTAQLLLGLLLIVPLIYWDGASLNLLLLLFWWCPGVQVGEQSRDEQDFGPDPDNQQFSERTAQMAEINQPNDHVDAADGKEPNSFVLDPSLYQSLRRVFECSYSQFILLWYNPPEPREDQPLYQVLLDEFNMAVDHAVGKIRHFNLTSIEHGLIRILTCHLRTAKKEKKREKIFQTRQEEVSFLRRTSEALICNLLPDSLWKLNCYRHILKEVVALKVLEEVINTVCDADFINQALIQFLDNDSPEIKVGAAPDAPPKTGTNDEIVTEYNIPKGNKEKESNKKRFVNIFKKLKRNKKKKDPEAKSILRISDEGDGQFGREFRGVGQSFRSLSPNECNSSDRGEDSAEEDFNSSNEMPEQMKQDILISTENEKSSLRNCKITISKVSWDEIDDPSCVIDIENHKAAEDCWSVWRKYHEFEELQKQLSKTFGCFVETKLLSVNSMSPDEINNEFKEDFKRQLNKFLEKLVSEESIWYDERTLNFFSANDQIREFWGLLTYLFMEEDEETDASSETSEGPCDMDVGEVEPLETDPEDKETQNWDSAESQPSEIFNESLEADCGFRCMPGTSETKVADTVDIHCRKRKMRMSKKKVERTTEQPECITSQLHELLGELFCTECFGSKVCLLVLKYVLHWKRKPLQKKLDQFFSKEQMIVYIDCLRETLWPNGNPAEPPPERSNEAKTFAKERAEKLLQKKLSASKLSPFYCKERVKVLLSMFQDAEMNKRLVYKVLVFLLFEIIPEIKNSWIGDSMLPCLERLNVDDLYDKPL